ncbi:MAG TPA: hypothetical protein HA348_03785 [Thermoplasmata archaeon]|nr:hypothetical protein [Thermoplasmata archaeon]
MDRRNRRGERFLCLRCGHETNADCNASRNLEALGLAGVYSLRSLPMLFYKMRNYWRATDKKFPEIKRKLEKLSFEP